MKRSKLDCAQTGRTSNGEALHKEIVKNLILRLIEHQEWKEALRLLRFLLLHVHESPEISFRFGIELLKHLEPTTNALTKEILLFYRKMSMINPKDAEMIVLETCFFQLEREHYEEAYELLMSFINIDPYKKNPLFLGYFGLICYLLWKRSLPPNTASITNLYCDINEFNFSEWIHKNHAHLKHIKKDQLYQQESRGKAIPIENIQEKKQYKKSPVIEEENENLPKREGHDRNPIELLSSRQRLFYDMSREYLMQAIKHLLKLSSNGNISLASVKFLLPYVKLLLFNRELESCMMIFQEFCTNHNNENIVALQHYGVFLLEYFPLNYIDCVDCFLKLLERDPVNLLAFNVLLYFTEQGIFDSQFGIWLLMNMIDYFPNECFLWERLQYWIVFLDLESWIDESISRLKWWIRFHFNFENDLYLWKRNGHLPDTHRILSQKLSISIDLSQKLCEQVETSLSRTELQLYRDEITAKTSLQVTLEP